MALPKIRAITLRLVWGEVTALECRPPRNVEQRGTVLLLHGFPDSAETWRQLLPVLANAGWRAVAPHLPGYEPSSLSPTDDYRLESIASRIASLIEKLDDGPVAVVGHDWGAATGYVLAQLHSEKVSRLCTMAVPPIGRLISALGKVPDAIPPLWYQLFFQLPKVSEFALAYRDFAFVKWLWRRWSPDLAGRDDVIAAACTTLAQPGVGHAALRYYRQAYRPWSAAWRALLRQLQRPYSQPVLFLYGLNDGCLSARLSALAFRPEDYAAGGRALALEGVGHFLHLEDPDSISDLVLQFLNSP